MKQLSLFILLLPLFLSACGGNEPVADEHDHEHEAEMHTLNVPSLSPISDGKRPSIVATTSIIGDVVARVGGDTIDLTTLMAAGQDPHSYEPAAQQLTAVANSDIIFVNGWDLEENLVQNLENIGGDAPLVPVSAGIEPLPFKGNDDIADPHVWFDVANVKQWTETTAISLSAIDPANAEIYAANAAAYQAELDELDSDIRAEINAIPPEQRKMVTNHGAFNYFANAYGVQIIGTVIPAMSGMAEPSAGEMAALIAVMNEAGVCSIFTETTLSDELAQTLVDELDGCEETAVYKLYTGAIGSPDSGADSYIDMMRANVKQVSR